MYKTKNTEENNMDNGKGGDADDSINRYHQISFID